MTERPLAPLTARGDKSRHGRLAQLVERLLYTQDVGGSSPSPPTIEKLSICFSFHFRFAALTLPLGEGIDVALSFTSNLSMASFARRLRSAFCV